MGLCGELILLQGLSILWLPVLTNLNHDHGASPLSSLSSLSSTVLRSRMLDLNPEPRSEQLSVQPRSLCSSCR